MTAPTAGEDVGGSTVKGCSGSIAARRLNAASFRRGLFHSGGGTLIGLAISSNGFRNSTLRIWPDSQRSFSPSSRSDMSYEAGPPRHRFGPVRRTAAGATEAWK